MKNKRRFVFRRTETRIGMKLTAVVTFILTMPAWSGLHTEAMSFLDRLRSRGYTAQAIQELELHLLEPCTLRLFLPESLAVAGVFAAMGGTDILDLHLKLEGDGWLVEDTFPDDMPVLKVDSSRISDASFLVVCARDMLRGASTDSAVVLWALKTVDRRQ